MSNQRPYYKYLFRDFLFGLAIVAPIGLWVLLPVKIWLGVTIAGLYNGATDFEAFLLAVAGTAIAAIVGLWRWNRIRSLFGIGVFVDALIIDATPYRLHLQYSYQENEFEKIISPPDQKHMFKAGQIIKIVIDPIRPKRMALAD